MNSVHSAFNAAFDALLYPLDLLGPEWALVLVSGIFGVLALWLFKYISWQKGIAGAKDRIKGHLIEIRIYQDDLLIVAAAVLKILLRNLQYMALNFGPILPLAAPFTLVAAQLVVRYGFEPVPPIAVAAASVLPGQGVLLDVRLRGSDAARASDLEIRLPEGLVMISPVVRLPDQGRALVEFVALKACSGDIELVLPGGARETKRFVSGGAPERRMQPERVGTFWASWLWPAEPTFASDSPFERVAFVYPDRQLRWLPDGPGGVLLVFLVAAMLFGALAMKPLGVSI
jgi:hypothetical protein